MNRHWWQHRMLNSKKQHIEKLKMEEYVPTVGAKKHATHFIIQEPIL